jgi:hypothetical protein
MQLIEFLMAQRKLLRIGLQSLLAEMPNRTLVGPRNPLGGPMPESSNPPAARVPDPNEKLVKVFDSEQESEAMVVKGLLDSAGIDSDLTSVDAVQDMFPGVGGMVILVREEDADRARRMIEDYKQSPDSDETSEIDLSEDTPTVG